MKINHIISQNITEGLRDPADNPCWKGYHPVGTKKKDGRTVPNCVPNANEGVAEGDISQLEKDVADAPVEPIASMEGIADSNINDLGADAGEYDYEGDMAKDDLETIVRAARQLTGMISDNENMPEWVQSKINKAADYVDTAADYMASNQDEPVDEGYYDSDDYYSAKKGGEYGRNLVPSGHGGYGDGPGRDDTLKGQSKNLPADPFARTTSVTPKDDGTGRVHKIALPGEIDEANKEKIGGRHDPQDFDDMVLRLKKLAGAGPMKTVYDPNTRRYKNMPTAVQPQGKK